MARRNEKESSGLGLKFTAFVIVVLLTIWAAHDPHQAAAVVNAIATAIANATSHDAHH